MLCLKHLSISPSYLVQARCLALDSSPMYQPCATHHPHLIKPGEITPGITAEEYASRRAHLASAMQKGIHMKSCSTANHMAIVGAGDVQYSGPDVPYPFRPLSDFVYLSGFLEPSAVLVVEARKTEKCFSTLFVPDRDADREVWDGPRCGAERAAKAFGVDQALRIGELDEYLKDRSKQPNEWNVWFDSTPAPSDMNNIVRRHFQAAAVSSLSVLVHAQRVQKSPAELELVRRAARSTARAVQKAMAASRANILEWSLASLIEGSFGSEDIGIPAFPSVVAGGLRATALHYMSCSQLLREGELVLVDSGAHHYGYSSDMTRTWPVSGKFTEPQAELYQVVLNVQKAVLKAFEDGQQSLTKLQDLTHQLFESELKAIKFLPDSLSRWETRQALGQLYPHHIGHFLGMDVHDCKRVSKAVPLQPGMVFAIEPGLYIHPDRCPSWVPKRYHGIGIRIEDSVVQHTDHIEVLTADCPKEIADLEAIVGTSTS